MAVTGDKKLDKMGDLSIARPERPDDYAMWEKYHLAHADAISREVPDPNLAIRIGQLQGEVDHRAAAMAYAELEWKRTQVVSAAREEKVASLFREVQKSVVNPESYQAGGQFAADPTRGIDTGREPHDLHLAEREVMGEKAIVHASDWESDDSGDYESRVVVGRTTEGYHGGVEMSHQGGDPVTRWADPKTSLQEAIPEAIRLEREWRDENHASFSQGVSDYKKESVVPEKDEGVTLDPSTLRMEREAIVSVANARAAVSQPELVRETQSYYNGRAAGFNDVLLAVKEQNPGREKDLPTPILMDEIRVRSMQQEQEQGKDKSLAIAR